MNVRKECDPQNRRTFLVPIAIGTARKDTLTRSITILKRTTIFIDKIFKNNSFE